MVLTPEARTRPSGKPTPLIEALAKTHHCQKQLEAGVLGLRK